MKITLNDKIQGPTHTRSAREVVDAGKPGFSAVLDKTMQGAPVRQSVSAQPPAGLSGLGALSIRAATDVAEPCCLYADKTIGLMERYQQQLADPRISLKDMVPLLTELKEEAGKMEASLAGLSADSPIRSALQETLIEVVKEVTRFEQGDYLDG